MVYRVIGLMSGSSLDGLRYCFVEFNEQRGEWSFEILAAHVILTIYEWSDRLKNAINLNALDYQLLHTDYGHYLGSEVNRFIKDHDLEYKVALIASHGHTTFHLPGKKMTAQLGDGAAIAAETGLPVVSDLRALDVAFGGQGAPIVPIGEKLLFKDYSLFLNIGGIANISFNLPDQYIAFDVCPANRVLNMIAQELGKEYDDGGNMAGTGKVNDELLQKFNGFSYYQQPYPKSLANSFGTDEIYPMIKSYNLAPADALATYAIHISQQIRASIIMAVSKNNLKLETLNLKLLVTGGGALNTFLISQIQNELRPFNIEVVVPEPNIVNYKEALVMAFIGVLRWRQEYNVISTVTGASRNSIGGALWIGQEA